MVHPTKRSDVDQPDHLRGGALEIAIEQQLILEALTVAAGHGRTYSIATSRSRWILTAVSLIPQRALSSLRVKRASVRAIERSRMLLHDRLDHPEHPARLRRQLIERAAEDFMRELVGEGDVIERHLDVFDDVPPGAPS